MNCGTCKGGGRLNKGKALCEPCGGLGHFLTIDTSGLTSAAELEGLKIGADAALLNMTKLTGDALRVLGRKR